MIGTTLSDIRAHIESLACEAGPYYLVCARTGDRPVPADGLTFECRATARAAARATEHYRTALRRYDPQLPYHDVVVCERATDVWSHSGGACAHAGTEDRHRGLTSDATAGRIANRSLIDFCHAVAGVVFETVAESSHAGLEDAMMDTYLAAAESIEDPDELCLRLLESMATELDARLDPSEQAALLRAAASRLPDAAAAGTPIDAALSALQSAALLETYVVRSLSTNPDPARSWEVTVGEYVLGNSSEEIVTLPIVVELFRYASADALSILDAEHVANRESVTWRLTLATAEKDDHNRSVAVVSES